MNLKKLHFREKNIFVGPQTIITPNTKRKFRPRHCYPQHVASVLPPERPERNSLNNAKRVRVPYENQNGERFPWHNSPNRSRIRGRIKKSPTHIAPALNWIQYHPFRATFSSNTRTAMSGRDVSPKLHRK